jgi:hypothetical protein
MRWIGRTAFRKHWGFRLLGIWLSVLLVGGQLAALGHLALVEHSVCPEHGELTHGHAARDDRASDVSSGQSAVSRARTGEDLGHEHCAFIARTRDALTLASAAASLAPAECSSTTLQAIRAEVYPLGRLAALYVAPKQSPPRV